MIARFAQRLDLNGDCGRSAEAARDGGQPADRRHAVHRFGMRAMVGQ